MTNIMTNMKWAETARYYPVNKRHVAQGLLVRKQEVDDG
jgi:hypothetical protein